MRRTLIALATSAMLVVGSAGAAFAADPSPGNSGHEGQGQTTAKFVPASTPGNS